MLWMLLHTIVCHNVDWVVFLPTLCQLGVPFLVTLWLSLSLEQVQVLSGCTYERPSLEARIPYVSMAHRYLFFLQLTLVIQASMQLSRQCMQHTGCLTDQSGVGSAQCIPISCHPLLPSCPSKVLKTGVTYAQCWVPGVSPPASNQATLRLPSHFTKVTCTFPTLFWFIYYLFLPTFPCPDFSSLICGICSWPWGCMPVWLSS